ncbi:MAG: FtsQ-type POTRA domain-containing protein [Mogibacterium sp.]|nr:FtsQ-type POTRA domain-containing protein [Mogibacterium sp.]
MLRRKKKKLKEQEEIVILEPLKEEAEAPAEKPETAPAPSEPVREDAPKEEIGAPKETVIVAGIEPPVVPEEGKGLQEGEPAGEEGDPTYGLQREENGFEVVDGIPVDTAVFTVVSGEPEPEKAPEEAALEEPEPEDGPETPESEESEAEASEPAEEEPEEPAEPPEEEPDEESRQVQKNIAGRKFRRFLRRHRPDPLKTFIVLGGILIVLVLVTFSGAFRLEKIEVTGNSYYTDEEIINMSHAAVGKNLIYQTRTGDIKEFLLQDPYIRSASVKRKLPHTLQIRVRERRQVAAVVYDEEFLVIDDQGLLLRRTNTEPKLTILRGLKLSKIEVGSPIEAEDPDILEKSLALLRAMREGDLYFIKINMSERYIKAYIYDSLVCTGRAEDLTGVIENGRLQRVIEVLFERNIKRGTITISTDGYASFVPEVA